jgi:MFS family permease
MFAWLVTMVLHESPQMVGVAQMAMLIPAMLFMLVGGSLADRFGGRRVALIAHSTALLPPFALLLVLNADALSFNFLIVYALTMGFIEAFVTPARDGLLNQVAEGLVQRTVVKATMIQFAFQLVGFVVAGQADRESAELILGVQIGMLLIGAIALGRIVVETPQRSAVDNPVQDLGRSVVEGFRTVMASEPMRTVALQNMAVGLFFMGSYVVAIPVLVREIYDGSAADLALLNAVNSLGLVLTIFLLLKFGDIKRQGRAMLLSHGAGAIALGAAGLGLGFSAFTACVFAWGAAGGVGMTMARTIMQEQAPENQRGRIMGFFSFSFMGAGPLGAFAIGTMAQWWGPELTIILAASCMFVVVVTVALASKLWFLDASLHTTGSMEEISSNQ